MSATILPVVTRRGVITPIMYSRLTNQQCSSFKIFGSLRAHWFNDDVSRSLAIREEGSWSIYACPNVFHDQSNADCVLCSSRRNCSFRFGRATGNNPNTLGAPMQCPITEHDDLSTKGLCFSTPRAIMICVQSHRLVESSRK